MTINEPGLQATTNPPEELKKSQSTPSRWLGLRENLLTAIIGGIPSSPGVRLRRLLYGTIFARMGKKIYIEDGVELKGIHNIELGDSAGMGRGVCINAAGLNNRVKLGSGVFMIRGAKIVGLDNNCTVEIGDNSFINADVWINGPGPIKIGKDCLLAPHVAIVAVNHVFADPDRPIRLQGHTAKGITIEDDCWLAYGVKVLDGVTIGQGSIIGAGAIVTKDIPPYSIAVGIPAKVIGKRGN
jgi:acetyltransferase-like isoleucine patch superfamily enzyme